MVSWLPTAVAAPETPTPPQPDSRQGQSRRRANSAAGGAASRDSGHSQCARTGRLAATAGKVARENPQRGTYDDDRGGEHERVESLCSPSAHSTTQTTRPAVTVRISPILGES